MRSLMTLMMAASVAVFAQDAEVAQQEVVTVEVPAVEVSVEAPAVEVSIEVPAVEVEAAVAE